MKTWFLSLPKWAQAIIVIGSAVLLILLAIKLWHWAVNYKNSLVIENSTVVASVGGTPVNINLGSIAQQIYSAFHQYYWGLFEDEDTAIAAVLNVPKSLIPQLKSIYRTLYDKDLNEEFLNYASSQYAQVANLFS